MSLSFINIVTIFMLGGFISLAGAALIFHFHGYTIANLSETSDTINRLESVYAAAEHTRDEMLRTADCCVVNINDAADRALAAHKQLEEILGDISNAG